MRKILCMLIAAALLTGMLAGCDSGKSDMYLERVYPPHYQLFYEELMGKDLPEVAQAMGYKAEDFTYQQFEGMAFMHNQPVEYLGVSFYPGLMFYSTTEGKQLGGLTYHAYLKEAPEEMAATVEYLAETLQKMFGYHYNGPSYRDPKDREYAFRDLDPQELAQQYAGDEQEGFGLSWILTDDVFHIPGATEEQCMGMEFMATYAPKESAVRVGLTYRLRQKYSNSLVRID